MKNVVRHLFFLGLLAASPRSVLTLKAADDTPKPWGGSTTFTAPMQPAQGIFPAPKPIPLHKELIPKNIAIVRCYYQEQIVGPGTTFAFDINGSGFTQEFHNMITVEVEELDVQVKNLRLVTANQIHGEIEVGPEALTAFIYPRVYIHHLPVFTAPEPFGVVRPGEVLYIAMTSVDDTGISGHYRVITNLDEEMFKRFHVEATTPGLEVGNTEPQLPFKVNGTILLGEHVPTGKYGLIAYLGKREIYREPKLVQIVHPNLGATGLIKDILAADPFQRPGRTFQLTLKGSSFASSHAALLKAVVLEKEMLISSMTYVSPGIMTFTVGISTDAKEGFYSVRILGANDGMLLQKKNVFVIVPANWIGYLRVIPEVHPGGMSTLKVIGRDFTEEFTNSLKLQLDEPGIHVGPLQRTDANTLSANFQVDAAVAPGDYLVTLASNDKPVVPTGSRIIKVVP